MDKGETFLRSKLNLGFLALMMGVAFFFIGKTLSPLSQVERTDEASVPSDRQDVDLGRFAISVPERSRPLVVAAQVTIGTLSAPSTVRMRDSLQEMMYQVLAMPVVAAEGFSIERLRLAILSVAADSAPWIKDITLAELN